MARRHYNKIVDGKKRCTGPCGKELELELFASDRAQASGRSSMCMECSSAKRRATYAENLRERTRRIRGSAARADENTNRADERDENLVTEVSRAERARLAAEEKTRIAREDRQRRVDSDFAQLKPDDLSDEETDFDTSVANTPERPTARGASKEASRQRRQEYSEAMGKQAQATRRAAVREARGEGEMLEDMPAEQGAYIGALAEQERRFGNRRVARTISLYAAGEELSRRLFVQAARQHLTGRVVPTGYAKAPPRKPVRRSVCVLLSDLHIGAELSGAENPAPYRATEEARRLEYIMRQAIDYKPQYRAQSELVLMLNGDLIEGMLLHDMRDGAPITEQKVAFQTYMERFVGECAGAFPSVRVFCQPGNHGRDKLRHPGRATSAKWDSHEWMMYYALSRACSSLKNVSFDLGFRSVSKIDLHGSTLGLTHGDTEVKTGDPDTKAKDNAAELQKINSTLLHGVRFDAWAFGHWHKPRYHAGNPRVVWNGALVPPNGHARSSGYHGEACGQFLWEAVPGFPVGDVRFIEVGRSQDHDEQLGTIIKPFRFDLE